MQWWASYTLTSKPLEPSCNFSKDTCPKQSPAPRTSRLWKRSLTVSHRTTSVRKWRVMQQLSHLFLWNLTNAFGILQLLKRTCCFSLLPSPWTLMMLLHSCSWSSLSCSVMMNGAANTSSFLLLTFTASWIKTGFQKCEHFLRKCWAYSAPHICVRRQVSVMNLNKNRLRSRLSDSHLRDILRISTTALKPDLASLLKSRSQYHPSH